MKGVILSYGTISAEDGKRYTFDTLELKNLGDKDPMKLDNSEVDFEVADENKAVNIFITKTTGFDVANKLANFNKEEVINNAKNAIKNFTIDGFCAFIQDHSFNAAKQKGLISAVYLILVYFGIFPAAFGFLTFVFATLAFHDLFKSKILTGLSGVYFFCFVLSSGCN